MKVSASKENHLKAIFHLQQEQGIVTTNALAAALRTRPASVTDMLKKLKEQKLLIYERYKGFKLSAEGKKAAVQVIRKHRLWEYFLVKKLQFGWEEVHEIAEELEHISSKKLIDRLDSFLDHPDTDPHGAERAIRPLRERLPAGQAAEALVTLAVLPKLLGGCLAGGALHGGDPFGVVPAVP